MSDRIPTFADICSAIAEGHIATSTDGLTYQVNALELRRYLNKFRSLPTISASFTQDATQFSASDEWTTSVHTSVA